MQRAKKDRQKEAEETAARKEEAVARRYYIKILEGMLSELKALRKTTEKDKQDGN